MTELKHEILNSNKLKEHFQDNPHDLQVRGEHERYFVCVCVCVCVCVYTYVCTYLCIHLCVSMSVCIMDTHSGRLSHRHAPLLSGHARNSHSRSGLNPDTRTTPFINHHISPCFQILRHDEHTRPTAIKSHMVSRSPAPLVLRLNPHRSMLLVLVVCLSFVQPSITPFVVPTLISGCHIYIYICIHTYIHTCIYVYIHAFMPYILNVV